MDESELLIKIKQMLIEQRKLRLSPDDLMPNTALNSLAIDSIDLVAILMDFERDFDIFFENEDIIVGNNTVQDLFEKINSKILSK